MPRSRLTVVQQGIKTRAHAREADPVEAQPSMTEAARLMDRVEDLHADQVPGATAGQ
jgi:hypothetical protein